MPIDNYLIYTTLRKAILTTIIILTGIGSTFAVSNAFTDRYILPKWYVFCAGAMLLFLLIGVALQQKRRNHTTDLINTSFIHKFWVAICILQALLGIVQYMGFFRTHADFKVVGTFDNPAGFISCICTAFPFGLLFFNRKKRWHWVGCLVVITAIVLSESRTGMIALSAIGLVVWCCDKKVHQRWKVSAAVLVVLMFVGIVGFYKTDSANGRMLIWECSWNMIKDKPLLGHGIHAFKAHYMDYQVAYFQEHPSSKYVMQAGNVNHPFNEFIGIWIQFGFIGLIGLVIILFLLWKCYRHNPTDQGKCAWLSLLAIGVCAMFSYPLTYPFVWLIILCDCFALLSNVRLHGKTPQLLYNMIGCILIVSGVFLAYKLARNIQAEHQWKRCMSIVLSKEEKMNKYEMLMTELGDNPYFLYNYAAELYYAGLYKESLEIAYKCKTFWEDYDLEMLIGENYKMLSEYNDAIIHFEKASLMVPVKFMPPYRMFQIYKEQKERHKLEEMANRIVNKPVKINSLLIERIKKEAKRTLAQTGKL